MIRRLKRIFLLLAGYYTIMLFHSCEINEDADFPYFDYYSIVIENQNFVKPQENFFLKISPDSSAFVVDNSNPIKTGFNFLPTAYADYNSDGHKGQKYFITSINVYADSVFNSAIAADQSLNSLFGLNVYLGNNNYKYVTLDSINKNLQNYKWIGFNYPTDETLILTKEKPVALNRPYQFEIVIEKQDGSVIRGTSKSVKW